MTEDLDRLDVLGEEVTISREDYDRLVRERDELRAAADAVCRSWFDRVETDVDPAMRQALVDLRAALRREDGAS